MQALEVKTAWMMQTGGTGFEYDSLPASDVKLLETYYYAKIEQKVGLISRMLGGGKKHGGN